MDTIVEKHSSRGRVPLKVWALTICLLIMLLLSSGQVLRLIQHYDYYYSASIQVNRERINRYAQQKGDRLRVIVLGTSLTKFATHWEADQIGFNSYGPVNLLNISMSVSIFDDFQPLLTEIIALRPDLVIIQDDLMRKQTIQLTTERTRDIFLRYIKDLRMRIKSKTYNPSADSIPRGWDYQKLRIDPKKFEITTDSKLISLLRTWYSGGFYLSENLIEFADSLRRTDGSLVILHMSRQSLLRQHFSELHEDWLVQVREQLRNLESVSFWISPDDYAEEDYGDYSHLNEHGREKFTEWLRSQLYGFSQRSFL